MAPTRDALSRTGVHMAHERAGRRKAWRDAFLGTEVDDSVRMPGLKASAENAGTIRDEAAREYEYILRAMESLDTKATACLAAALAMFAFASGVDGEAWARWLTAILSLIAGIFSASALSPDSVRLPKTQVLADRHGADTRPELLLQVAAQYVDAVEAARHPITVKAIRLRVSLVLLFAAATSLALH